MEFPNGFETKVGERGLTLSGGQKQRISIARSIIRKPAILLFDDCLSAVDTETEETILQNLRRIMTDRTTIIISHRISSVKQCDEIIVLDHGQVSERGTHQYLLSLNGQYAEMHQKQLLDKEINPVI
jgi:ATP-binding cassette subfamily B protein